MRVDDLIRALKYIDAKIHAHPKKADFSHQHLVMSNNFPSGFCQNLNIPSSMHAF